MPLEIESVAELLWILVELVFSTHGAFGLETFWELSDCPRIVAAHWEAESGVETGGFCIPSRTT